MLFLDGLQLTGSVPGTISNLQLLRYVTCWDMFILLVQIVCGCVQIRCLTCWVCSPLCTFGSVLQLAQNNLSGSLPDDMSLLTNLRCGLL